MLRRSSLIITGHLAARMRQRGYKLGDLEALEDLGTEFAEGIFVRKRDTKTELNRLSGQLKVIRRQRTSAPKLSSAETTAVEQDLIQRIGRLHRLTGTFVPLEDGHALSIYHPCDRRAKHILRGRRTFRHRRGWRVR